MNNITNRYVTGRYIRLRKKKPTVHEYIGQCINCLDVFTVFYTVLEGIDPSPLTFYEIRKDDREGLFNWLKNSNIKEDWWKSAEENSLIHKCGGKVNIYTFNGKH